MLKIDGNRKVKNYHLVDRLIHLVLTFSISTTTTKRVFSAIKNVKTRIQNKIDDEFLSNNLVVYIEKEIATTFSTYSIIAKFESINKSQVQLF